MIAENKTWILNVLAHKATEKVPYHFGFTPPVIKKLEKHYGTTLIEDRMNLPIRMSGPKTKKPFYTDMVIHDKCLVDEFGVSWSVSNVDRGSPVVPALKEANLSGYTFPDPTLNYRFEDLGNWCDANREHFRVLCIGDLWERATFMRGMENILVDLALNQKFVFELLENLTMILLKTMDLLVSKFDFETVLISDDYGMQNSLLMSPADWRKFIKPQLIEIFEAAKRHGKYIMLHSCGNVFAVIGDLVDIGLDILHPIQPEAMNIFSLKQEFGGDITLQGGISTQDLLPYGTENEIRSEIKMLKEKMGEGGGYIMEPGITLQGDIPLNNLIALIEEVTGIE